MRILGWEIIISILYVGICQVINKLIELIK
jgi:hypothetical protein